MRFAFTAALTLTLAAATGCGSAHEVESAQSAGCATCHGYPPPPGLTAGATHPPGTSCALCHAETVDANGALLPSGKHQDGKVEVTIHAMPYVPQHTAAALANLGACTACHGADYSGGESGVSCNACHATLHATAGDAGFADWRTNCTFCHGTRTAGWTSADPTGLTTVAPPSGVHGETLTTQNAVGAHQSHLRGSSLSNGVACTECHTVPTSLAHVDGAATLTFGTLARTGGLAPQLVNTNGVLTCASTYCHGTSLTAGSQTVPTWTGSAGCGTCHGLPPSSGLHGIPQHLGIDCYACHQTVADQLSDTIRDDPAARALHVNGVPDVQLATGSWSPSARTCSNVQCHTGTPIRAW